MEQLTTYVFTEYLRKNGNIVRVSKRKGVLPSIRTLEADDVVWEFKKQNCCYLDGSYDNTHVNWLRVRSGCTPEEGMREYAAVKAAVKALFTNQDAEYSSPVIEWGGHTSILLNNKTFLRVREPTVLPDEKREELRRLCEEAGVCIIEDTKFGNYRDILSNIVYSLYVKEYPGSADDAASYGSILLGYNA